jgi:hypothetical protein
MTIKDGMSEAFRRLGATEEEITRCMRMGPSDGIGRTLIDADKEERFIEAYMKLVCLIQEGPGRQAAEDFLERRRANN